jgi:amidase
MTLTDPSITRLSAAEIARRVASGTLSSVDVVEEHLHRIGQLDGTLHAFLTVDAAGARAAARLQDNARQRGAVPGLLSGVPIGLKDLVPTAGLRTTFGSQLFSDNVPVEDDLVVTRLRTAGAIIVGKTNTPEFGFGARCANLLAGSTLNPYDRSRRSGGSSGGSAVAVTSGMCALGHGTDFGGSVRTPAGFCGIVGLRPTPGRIPSPGRALGHDMLSTTGILARDVADAALMLAALAGPDARDPLSLHFPALSVPDFAAVPTLSARVAATVDFGIALVALEVADLFEEALAKVESLVGAIPRAHPDCRGAVEAFETLRAAHVEFTFSSLLRQPGEQLSPTVRWNIERGRGLAAHAYLEAERQRTRIYRSFANFFEKFDVLLAPTTSVLPFPDSQENVTEINGVRLSNMIEYLAITYVVSLVGFPVIALPAAWTAQELPLGIQLIGRPGCEAELLATAWTLQEKLGFRHRWPPDTAAAT